MASGMPPKDLAVHRENRQGWVYFNHYSSTNCNVYDVTHATGVEIGLCRPRRRLDHAAAGSVLHYLSEQDGNVYVREYADLKCRNTKTKWDLATRRFHDVETEVTINSCTMKNPEINPEHAYSQKVSNEKKLPLYGTYVISLGFDDYDTCAYTQQLQNIHTATLATHYSAQYGGCQLIDGKYQIFDCSSGSPTLNVYIDKSCSRLAHAIPLGHSCVEGVQDGEYIAYSYWSCSLNGDILPIVQPKVAEGFTSYGYILLITIGFVVVLGIVGLLYLLFSPRKKLKNDDDILRTPQRNFQSYASPFKKNSSGDNFRTTNLNSDRFTVQPGRPVSQPPTGPLTMRNVKRHSPTSPHPHPSSANVNQFDVEDQPPVHSNASHYTMPSTHGAITSSAVAAAAASSGHNMMKSSSTTSAATTHAHSSPTHTSSSLEQTLSIKERLKALKDDDMHKNMPTSPRNNLAKKFGNLAVTDDSRGGRRQAPSVASTRLSSSSGSYTKKRHGSSRHHGNRDYERRSRSQRKSSRRYSSSDEDSYETDDSYSDSYSEDDHNDNDSMYSYDTDTDSSEDEYRSKRSHPHHRDSRRSSKSKHSSRHYRNDRRREKERNTYKDDKDRYRNRHNGHSSSKRHRDPYRDRDMAYRERDREHGERDRDRSRSASVSSRRSHHREDVDRDRGYISSRSRSPPPTHMQPPPPFSHYSPIKESRGDRGDPYRRDSRHSTSQQRSYARDRETGRSASTSSRDSSRGKTVDRNYDQMSREYVPPMESHSVQAAGKSQSSSKPPSPSNLRIDTSLEGTKPHHTSKSPSGRPVLEMGRKSLGLTRLDRGSGSSGNLEETFSQSQPQQFSAPPK